MYPASSVFESSRSRIDAVFLQSLLILLALFASGAGAQSGPIILQFTASPSTVTPPQSATLVWNSFNTNSCRTTNNWGIGVPSGFPLGVVGAADLPFPVGTAPGLRSYGMICCLGTVCTPQSVATVNVVVPSNPNVRVTLTPSSLSGEEGSSVTLTARLENCGDGCFPASGQQLNFQNLSGAGVQFSSSSGITNAQGNVTVTAFLPFAGTGSIRVSNATGDGRTDAPVNIGLGPRFLSVEPNPLVVPLNGQIQASLRVRTQANLPVPNEPFTISYSGNPGAVTGPASVVSNTSGTALLPLTGVTSGNSQFVVTTRGIANGQQAIPVSVTSAMANRSGTYWNPQESGHGLFIMQAGNTLVPAWYTYDTDGKPLWFLISGATLQADGSYTGGVFRYTGAPFNQAPADSVQTSTQVGNARFRFTGNNAVEFNYTINNQTQTRNMVKFDVAPNNPLSCVLTNSPRSTASNYTDLWWNPAQQGWGLNILHQGSTIFFAWYTYGFDLRPMWVTGLGQRQANGSFTGELTRPLTGTPWPQINGAPATAIPVPTVGNFTLSFSNGETGTFSYTLDGNTQTRSIRRFEFGSPATVCSSG